MSAQTRSEIEMLLEQHGLSPRPWLGQHFLADANITRKIVALADIREGDQVVEVGAGTGTLTAALGETGARVVAYEVDRGLAPILESVANAENIELRFEDAMKVDLGQALGDGRWKMIANLPYNVGTPLVLDSIRNHHAIVKFVVMVQKEVAARFTAQPGGRDYGLPSVVAQMYTAPSVEFSVPPQVFVPPPRVASAVAVMDRIEPPALAETAIEIAAAAFGQRRKMLRKSLVSIFEDPVRALEAADIDPTLRPESLSSMQFLKLAREVK